MVSQNPIPDKRNGSSASQLAMALELPFTLIISVLLGGGIGYLLDRWLHIAPAMMLVGGLLGAGCGIWDILRRLTRQRNNQEARNGRE